MVLPTLLVLVFLLALSTPTTLLVCMLVNVLASVALAVNTSDDM